MRTMVGCLFLVLTGCTSPSIKQMTDPNTFYKRDFAINVNGVRGDGVVIAPSADLYKIQGTSKGELNLMSIRSCHREWVKEEVGGRTFNYDYTPVSDREQKLDCILDMGGFDIKNGRHSWGFIGFEDPLGVSAAIVCNGELRTGKTTVCQAPAGLIQEIHFAEDMAISPDPGSCASSALKDTDKRGRSFEYVMPERECVLSFVSVSDQGARVHAHYTVGYKSVMLREN